MAKAWQLPQWRRVVMQLLLWVVLAGTVGLATLVRHHRLTSLAIPLGPLEAVDSLRLRLPVNWSLQYSRDGITLMEPRQRGRESRAVHVVVDRAVRFRSPLEYIIRRNLVPAEAVAADPRAIEPVSVAGWPGVLVKGQWQAIDRLYGPVVRQRIVAAALLPSGQMAMVWLDGDISPADIQLVRDMADSLRIEGLPLPQAAQAAVELAGGVRFQPPAGFVILPGADPAVSGVRLVRGGDGPWRGIELTACLRLPDDGPQALYAMLGCRDPLLRVGLPQTIDPFTWACRRQAGDYPLHPAAAYLLAGPGGQAVLVEFRDAPPEEIERLWPELARDVVLPSVAVDTLLEAGARAAAQAAAEAPSLLARLPAEQWWRWYDDSPRPLFGRTHATHEVAGHSANGTRQTHAPALDGSPDQIVQHWQLTASALRYSFVLKDETDRPLQRTEVTDQHISTVLAAGAGPSWSGPLPPQYVPGALLPAVLGRLPDRPMILRTESFLAAEGTPAAGLLTLVIRPCTHAPRQLDGEPLRCLTVELNGTGQTSHWHFRPDGTPQFIDLPGGTRIQRSDKRTVEQDESHGE